MRMLLAALGVAVALPVAGLAADTTAAYDLLFRTGTLDGVDRDTSLVYDRDVDIPGHEEAARRDTGRVAVDFGQSASGPESALVTFRQDDQHRTLGEFPASVGNPLLMLFYEFTVRDMAETVGGSPFYIRNRMKDALTRDVPVEEGTAMLGGEAIDVQRVVLKPFEGDPNAAQMAGFDALALTVTMSEAVPGWYLSLVAEVPGGERPVYRSEVSFEDQVDAQ